jgi:hypothetical protein
MIAGSEVVLLIRRSRLRHERHHFLCRAAKRRAVWRGGMRSRKIDAEMCTATFLWPQSGDGDHQRDDRRISFRPIGIGQRQQRLRGSTSAPRSRNAPAVCDGSGRTVDGSASGNTLDSSTIGCRGRAAHARRSFPFSRLRRSRRARDPTRTSHGEVEDFVDFLSETRRRSSTSRHPHRSVLPHSVGRIFALRRN